MDITLKKADRNDIRIIGKLYKKAFPKDEQAPFLMLKSRYKQGRAELLCAETEGKFAGFVYLVFYSEIIYLFYFAVAEDMRGRGIGSAILSALHEKYKGKKIFLAREQPDISAPNYEQRVSRREFYLRNGFKDTENKIKEGNVVYDVMSTDGEVSSEEYRELIRSWTGKLLFRLVDMRIIERKE